MSRTASFWLFLILLGATVLALREHSLRPDGRVHLHMFDVGQGDAMLLISPAGKQIVIDGGPSLELLEHLGRHMPFLDRTIELLILSHPDADHITALPEVLKRYAVKQILMTGAQHNSSRYRALLALLEKHQIQVILADPEKDIAMGDGLVLDVLWSPPSTFGVLPENANDPSVVFKALYRSGSILFAGDIEEKAEAAILATGADLRADILKVAHHGSRTSSSTGFILAVDPNLALISAGRDNAFGHPHSDVLSRFETLEIPVRSTSKEGTISLSIP